MNFVLLGPPGAGKGTHAKIIADNYGLVHTATGDILRKHISEASNLGMQAKDVIESGGLVSDDLVNAMMFEEIKQLVQKGGIILDGYPRTIGQAEALDRFLLDEKISLDAVISFNTSEKVVLERLSGRRICSECNEGYHIINIPSKVEGVCDECGGKLIQRKDDQPDTIKNRLENYHRETAPLIEYYGAKGNLKTITGDLEVTELQVEITELIQKLKPSA